jgi:hypothetical protein
MRAIATIFLLCMSSAAASAQTTEQCQLAHRAADLLNCYNGIAPARAPAKPKTSKAPTAPHKPAASEAPIAVSKSAASETPTDKAQYIDGITAENSKLDAKMKTICRGC